MNLELSIRDTKKIVLLNQQVKLLQLKLSKVSPVATPKEDDKYFAF